MRIEVCGAIASGKTSIAKVLQSEVLGACLENFQANPFWKPFYSEPGKHIFETELTFLLQHYHNIKAFDSSHKHYVCDFSPTLDMAYARIGLIGSKLEAFETIHKEVIKEVGWPDLLLHLSCGVGALLDRINARARDVERNISSEFLSALDAAIRSEVEAARKHTRILFLDTERDNYLVDGLARKRLLTSLVN
jgi:deoxyadenosine/deoxycytidine kinase